MSNGSEVLIYLSFLLKEAVIYLVAAATPNKHMVAMYQKLSFSDFILFYNSKNRHLEFLNLSPQGLISSIFYDQLMRISFILFTEPRWALQPQSTQWFPRIGLFVVQAISLGPCRWLIEFLTSSHPCGRLSEIQNSQTQKVEKWKF